MEDNIYKCSEEEHDICLNNAMCYLCDGKRLYKRPKWMDVRDREKERKKNRTRKKPKEGMDFEKRVQKAYNKKFAQNDPASANSRDIARRRPNSGAIWSMPGDITTEEGLFECKERGSKTSKGEKTITIQKHQLDKIKQESYQSGKDTWYYVFGYKNSDEIYLVKDFEDELRMIQQIKILKSKIEELENGGTDNAEG